MDLSAQIALQGSEISGNLLIEKVHSKSIISKGKKKLKSILPGLHEHWQDAFVVLSNEKLYFFEDYTAQHPLKAIDIKCFQSGTVDIDSYAPLMCIRLVSLVDSEETIQIAFSGDQEGPVKQLELIKKWSALIKKHLGKEEDAMSMKSGVVIPNSKKSFSIKKLLKKRTTNKSKIDLINDDEVVESLAEELPKYDDEPQMMEIETRPPPPVKKPDIVSPNGSFSSVSSRNHLYVALFTTALVAFVFFELAQVPQIRQWLFRK